MIMRNAIVFVAVAVTFIGLTAGTTTADHNSLVSTEAPAAVPDRSSLDVDLKLGLNGFRLGARVFGDQGYTGGAWLNGETRPEGFSVDGRVERGGGKAW